MSLYKVTLLTEAKALKTHKQMNKKEEIEESKYYLSL